MKHLFTLATAAFFLVFVPFSKASAQVSEGGTPPGFKFTQNVKLPVEVMPAINVDSMLQEDALNEHNNAAPFRFGYNHLVYLGLNNSGTWTNLPNGDRIWQLDVKTPGAYNINLAFTNFHLPAGAKLFVYSKDHAYVFGPFNSANNTPDHFFGTDLLKGDEAVIEYYEPAAAKGQCNLVLFRITQGYRDIRNYLKAFGDAGSCIHNINCPQFEAYWTQKRGVVCLVTGTGNEFCSGSLINDNRNDGTPYLLTANHCGIADGTWVFRFNWEAPGCPNPPSDPGYQSVTGGGNTVAHCDTSDFNLVLMNSSPPCNFHVFYNGWTRSTTPASSVVGIHHPSGDIKKGSIAANPVTPTSYDAGNGTAQVWEIGQWTDGVTEPGSSGSPLFDQNKRIVGQLYGGPSACGEIDSNLRDFYGRFCVSWDTGGTPGQRLKDWLDPDNTNAMTNDGYDPCPAANSLDVALTTVVSPIDSSCSDSIQPVVNIKNFGSATLTSVTIKYHVDSGADAVYTWSGSLVYLGALNVALPAMAVTPGNHTFYANVSQPNNLADQNPANDSANSIFKVVVPTGVNAPIVQGFEGSGFPPSGWTVTPTSSGTTWESQPVGGYGTSNTSAAVDEFDPISSTVGETPGLISPSVDMANISGPATLKFDVAYARYSSSNFDSLNVLTSIDCGVTWNAIYANGGTSLATAPDITTPFVPTSAQWRTETLDIGNLIGQPSVIFNFQVVSGWGQFVYLDNINLSGTVGIHSVTDNLKLRTFPNPFSNEFNIQFELEEAENITAGLYSTDGKLVSQVMNNTKMDAGAHQLKVNTAALSSGLYFLKVNQQFIKLEKIGK